MKKLSRIALLLTLIVAGAGTPALHARNHRPRVLKAIDVSKESEVIAAKQRHKDAEKALDEAKAKPAKSAEIEAAQKEHDETQKALSQTLSKAIAAAKKKQGYR